MSNAIIQNHPELTPGKYKTIQVRISGKPVLFWFPLDTSHHHVMGEILTTQKIDFSPDAHLPALVRTLDRSVLWVQGMGVCRCRYGRSIAQETWHLNFGGSSLYFNMCTSYDHLVDYAGSLSQGRTIANIDGCFGQTFLKPERDLNVNLTIRTAVTDTKSA